MGQQNVDCIWHDQCLEVLQSPFASLPRGKLAAVVYPDQIKRLVTQPDKCAFLAQDADTLVGEQASDGRFNLHVRLMVSEASENAVRRSQARQRTNHLTLGFRVPTDVVPGQRDQVWF